MKLSVVPEHRRQTDHAGLSDVTESIPILGENARITACRLYRMARTDARMRVFIFFILLALRADPHVRSF